MFDDFEKPPANSINTDEAFELLQDLGRNTPEEIRRQRTHFRMAIKSRVTLQPGNASELLRFKIQGTTGDVSQGGLSALFPLPALVGDVYRLQFDQNVLDLPLTFARCVRCRVVREDAFEAGFSFFMPITLPQSGKNQRESQLIS